MQISRVQGKCPLALLLLQPLVSFIFCLLFFRVFFRFIYLKINAILIDLSMKRILVFYPHKIIFQIKFSKFPQLC